MQMMEFVAHRGTDIIIALAIVAIGKGESFEIRNRFDVPNDDVAHAAHELSGGVIPFALALAFAVW
jgi:hypothetical protein